MTTSYTTLNTSSLGTLLLVASPTHLLGIYFADRPHAPTPLPDWSHNPKHPLLAQTRDQLQAYLRGTRTEFSIPLKPQGTPFQQKIWHHIAQVPFGQTLSYADLARRAGNPKAIRAAGTATGKNPLSIVIPCHRILAKNQALAGYAGGLSRKSHLLKIERRSTSQTAPR